MIGECAAGYLGPMERSLPISPRSPGPGATKGAGGRVVNTGAFGMGRAQAGAKTAATWEEISDAARKVGDFFHKTEKAGSWDKVTKEDFDAMAKLVKITGRRKIVYGGQNYQRLGGAGALLDKMDHSITERLANTGNLPELMPTAPTAKAMAKKLALYTGGSYTWRNPTTWTTSHGWRHRDPADHVEYPSRTDFESAWAFLSGVAEPVSYLDHLDTRRGGLKFGRYLLERASTTSLDGSRVNFLVSVRTMGSLKNLVVLS